MLWFRSPRRTWEISPPQWEKTIQGQRVSALIGGHPVWFESADAALTPAPEAFVQAMLIPALHQRTQLQVNSHLDATWLANVEALIKVISSWWDYPSSIPVDGAAAAAHDSVPPGRHSALCFTGGVDSFHSLLHGSTPIDCLLFVHGFDIALGDAARMHAVTSTLRQVASAFGKRLIIVRTNLREHPLFRTARWERTHGAALAAVGHLLAPELRRLIISATFRYPVHREWGSHWEIDHFWSSSRMQIVGELTTRSRIDKLATIGGNRLVQQHLRVCWKNLAATGNCSRCEKCVRTMAMLDVIGHLQDSQVFAPAMPIADLIDALPSKPPHTTQGWQRLSQRVHSAEVRQAIERLLGRSTVAPSRLPAFLRKLLRALPRVA